MRWLRVILPSIVAAICAATPTHADVWDRPPLSASAKAILDAAREVPPDEEHGVQILLDEGRFSVDEAGRVEFTAWMVYRVDSPGAVRGWAQVSRSWRPWHQDRPEIRARVITPDGQEHPLDPETLGEYADDEAGPDVYGDRKTLKGPLPAIRVGSIVEELHVVRDREPEFAAGTSRSFVVGQRVPVQRTRVTLEAPESLPLRYEIHRLPHVEPNEQVDDGRKIVRFESGPVAPWSGDTSFAPGEIARRPVVRFSTGASWNAIASSYAEFVDQRIASSDVRGLVKKVVGKRKRDRDEVIARLVDHLHEKVRYTGLEFGEGSIVPTAPDVTLERKFGDCKDKATLLVAMLRESGIESHVALLNTGPGSDVDPGLPGMGRFDHAIVHVPGSPELWIDATAKYARAGQLPAGDLGRLALIAAPSTTELVRTPDASSADSVRSETREVFLARRGGARIVETTEMTGQFEQRLRSSLGRKNDAERREQLERYVKGQYRAESLGEIEVSDPEDRSAPLRLRVEAEGCEKAWTSDTQATVALGLGALIRDLPRSLKPDGADEDDEETTPRVYPMVLQEPFRVEIDYRIHPPPGFAPTGNPESSKRTFGPTVLTQEFRVEDDGTVEASLRFDTVKTRLTVGEIEAVRTELAAFYKEKEPRVVFYQVGEAHLEAGRLREALAEFRGLVERYPDEAIHHTQVARAYLAAGLGANARAEAQRAVELEPDSMQAQRSLGLILAHDELGRKFVAGFDHAGAEAALREAKRLDDEDYQSRGELAILLEHDPIRGERYGANARLDEAIVEYRNLRRDLEAEGLTTNLLAALLHADRYEEVSELWTEAPRNDGRDALHLAALSVVEDTDAAVEEASRISGDAEGYREILATAADWLSQVRQYPQASALLAASAKGDAKSIPRLGLADLLQRVQRHETLDVSPRSPEGLVRAFTATLLTPEAAPLDLFLPSVVEPADRETLELVLDDLRDLVAWMARQEGLSGDRALDWLLSTGKFSKEGNDEIGYRIRMRPYGASGSIARPVPYYAVLHGDEYRLVGFAFARAMIGHMLLARLDASEPDEAELERARHWLDWLAEDAADERGEDELDSPPLRWLWRAGRPRDLESIRLAAASLMVDGTYDDLVTDVLQAASDSLDEGDERLGVDLALLRAFVAEEDPERTLEVVDRLAPSYPRSTTVFLWKIRALIQLDRLDDAEAAIVLRTERIPGEELTATLHAEVAHRRGDLDVYRERLTALIDSGRATAAEYNNLAWLDIVEERASEETLGLAQQSVALTDYSEVSSLHTLATVYAELGQVAEARDVLLALLDNRTSNDLESPDWYVLGRIAEHYGAPDAAVEAYRKVEPPEDDEPDSTSTHGLAARRLEGLSGTP